jgi:5'-methylthioadenosine phosphorylase
VAKDLGLSVHQGGTYVCIEGPQFSTKAESKVFRSLGFSIIGMTNLPEAKLAREAEICYATIGLVTDYDVWKEGEEVSVERVVGNLLANIENVKKLIKAAIPRLERARKCECASALAYAIQTRKWAINKRTAKKLDLLIGKYLKK